jgi:cysteine-rich repeat protein
MSSRRVAYLLCLVASATFVVVCSDDVKPPPADRGVDKPAVTEGGPKPEGMKGDGGSDVVDCTGKADGFNCAAAGQTGMICLGGTCLATSCGDKYVDAANGEECDDGNTDPTDGCNNCKFNCKIDADCDDKNKCNGTETCDTTAHTCKLGTPAPDATKCNLTGVDDGVCNGGVCAAAGCGNGVKDGTEECDDGNKVDGDGCDNNCKFSCHADTDCDDGNKCNGIETCKKEATKQACAAGTALDCDDKKACTTDLCIPQVGCMHIGIDADKDGHVAAPCGDDCNDADPTIYGQGGPHHECKDGKDNDCDGLTDEAPLDLPICWADPDGDSYATKSAATILNCSCPKGYTNRNPLTAGQADCQGNNATVSPAQTGWFTKAYCTGLWAIGIPPNPSKCLGTLSFDYNCDGTETPHWPNVTSATGCKGIKLGPLGKLICFGDGWSGTIVAGCGVQAKYTDCVPDSTGKTCLKQEVLRTQECQ